MLNKAMSIKILEYFIKKEGFSKEILSQSMGISVEEINSILNNKSSLNRDQLDKFVKENHIKMWEFIEEIIPPQHIPEAVKKKLEICKMLAKILKEEKKEV